MKYKKTKNILQSIQVTTKRTRLTTNPSLGVFVFLIYFVVLGLKRNHRKISNVPIKGVYRDTLHTAYDNIF